MGGKAKTAIVLILLCAIIAVVPLAINTDSEFAGSDSAAEDVIAMINPEYEAWAKPIMEPPGGETESLLFCLQAAIGAGILGFGIGILKEKNKKRTAEE